MRDVLRLALATVAGASVALLAACSSPSTSHGFTFHGAQKIGTFIPVASRKAAENFSGTLLNGTKFSSAVDRGKVTVINFWAAWCPPCRIETPQFDSVYRHMKGTGVDFVGVDTKDTHTGGAAFVAEKHISYPVVYDQEGRISEILGGTNLPSLPYSILIDKQDRVAGVYAGALEPADIQPMIDKLEAER